MRVITMKKDTSIVEVTLDEMMIFQHALNETCNALDILDFSTRMGVELSEARALLTQTSQLIDKMRQVQNGIEETSL